MRRPNKETSQVFLQLVVSFPPREGGGGGYSAYERGGDARRFVLVCKFWVWSHLGCSGKNAIIFSPEGLV